MRKQRQISTPCPKHPGQTRKNPEGNPHTHPRAPLALPSSWAVVKADGSPSSSITEQLLLGSHIVPTSAMPSVSQVLAPHRSCRDGGKNKSQPEISDRYRRDLMGRKGIPWDVPAHLHSQSNHAQHLPSQVFSPKGLQGFSQNQPRLREEASGRKPCGSLRRFYPNPTQRDPVGGNQEVQN